MEVTFAIHHFLISSVDIFHSSSGPSMILTLRSTKNSRLMNSLELYPTNRTGSGMILFLTTKNAMVKPLNLHFVELNVTSLRSTPALSVMHHNLISLGMIVRKNHRFVARSVLISTLHLKITESLKLISFVALIVLISLSL